MTSLTDFSTSALSLLPPLVALGLAIVTRRVLLSLGLGILLGALLLNNFSPLATAQYIGNAVFGLFIDDGSINSWNMSIILFLVLLGMMTALLTLSGGTRAFADWAQRRIHNKRGSNLLAAFLGMFIFVDDYFNSLAVGSVAGPVSDRFKVSRAKLAYILDSTAAPMCVLMPASSWGAYIITLIGGILVSHGLTDQSAFSAFVALIPMNFYALFALLMVLAVAWFGLDIGPMRRRESDAAQGNDLSAQDSADTLESELATAEGTAGRVSDLILPISVLVISTISFMIGTGAQALAADGKAFGLLSAFENTDVGASLCYGTLLGLAVSLLTIIRQKMPVANTARTLWLGARSMSGAITVLFFAWTIGGIIGDMATGKYLSTLVQGNLNPQLLPVLLFLLAAVMAFSTGTSWGTFGIMLPIAGDLAAATDLSLMLPVLAAVLAGAVFGDHCSPISDTTILSSTGARCRHIDHVATQLPYALATALVAATGFLTLGLTGSVLTALAVASVIFIACCTLFLRLARAQ